MTLIELMVGIAVLVIVLAIGVPSFEGSLNGSRISSTTNELLGGVQFARTEAIRRNRSVVLCRTEDLATCATGDTWSSWLVFEDSDGDGAVTAGEAILRTGTIGEALVVRDSLTLSGLDDRVRFLATGMARGATGTALLNASISVCAASTRPVMNARDVVMAFGGRTSVRQRNTGGDCSARPSDT